MAQMTFEINGQSYTGEVEDIKGTLWVHLNGRTFCVESEHTQRGRRKKRGGGASDPSQIVSTMPGKVTKVFVEKGKQVKKGDSILVLEAMKMEYNLKAVGDGKVESVLVEVGAQVKPDQVLVKIKQ